MIKQKNTKRALLASLLSLVLCVAMLVGTSFAWFTDGVSTANNKIVAGNLDVALYNIDGGVETEVTEETNLFDSGSLWEPGHVEVVNLKIANLGSLALTYQFSINVASEIGSVNVYGNEFMLSDYIEFAVIEGNQSYESRDAAITAAEEAGSVPISQLNVNDEDVLYPAGSEDGISEKYVTLVVYMPTSVGNDANYMTYDENGDAITPPEIALGVTLVATQTPYESDSFNEYYDEDLDYPTLISDSQGLKNAEDLNGTFMLNSDISFDATGYASVAGFYRTSTLELNNHTITMNSSTNSNIFYALEVLNNGKLTINGPGTVEALDDNYCIHLYGYFSSRPELTINGGTYKAQTTAVNVQWGTAYINGGFFDCGGSAYTVNCIDDNYRSGRANIVITGGTFVDFDPSADPEKTGSSSYVAEGYTVVSETQFNGEVWYTVVAE